MRLLFFCILYSVIFFHPSQAQETIVKDSGIVAPFRGELRYHLSWKGKGFDELKEGLPDSMVVTARADDMFACYYHGRSDSLLQCISWQRNTGKILCMYPALGFAWEELPDSSDTLKAKLRKENQFATIKGKSCRRYSLEWNNKEWKEEFWMWEGKVLDAWNDSIRYSTLPPLYYPGMKGLPFRYIRTGPEGKCSAELKEMQAMEGVIPGPALPEGMEILPMPTRASFRHPAWDAKGRK